MTLILLIISNTYALIEKDYVFIIDEGNPLEGKCFLVDKETMGEKIRIKEKKIKCRPQNYSYAFSPSNGKCYEIDDQTSGKKYINKTKIKNCKTKDVIYEYRTFAKKSGCFEFDKTSEGKNYYKKVNESFCSNHNSYKWIATKKLDGSCYAVIDDKEIAVKDENCKPEITKLAFIDGRCYQLSPKGVQYYVKKINIKKCKPTNITYMLRKNDKGLSDCYEVDAATNGGQYYKKVQKQLCKQNI